MYIEIYQIVNMLMQSAVKCTRTVSKIRNCSPNQYTGSPTYLIIVGNYCSCRCTTHRDPHRIADVDAQLLRSLTEAEAVSNYLDYLL